MFNKIIAINKNMISAGRKDAALNPGEEALLQELRAALEASKPIPAKSLDLVVRIVTQWPYSDRLAGLDLLRCMAKHHVVAQYSSDSYGSLVDLAISASLPSDETPNENAVMMGARTLANIFGNADGRSLANSKCDTILAFLDRVLGIKGGEAIGKFNRNVLIAVATTTLNLSVLVNKEKLLVPNQRRRLLSIIGAILSEQSDSEVLYRAFVALGTTLTASPEAAKGLEVKQWMKLAAERTTEDRVIDVANECSRAASK